MNRWLHSIRLGALALSLTGMLANCGGDGDGGGGGGLRLFFGMNGSGQCTTVIATIELTDAEAVLGRDNDGDVDCVLDTVLTGNGCDVSFLELDDRDRLQVTISGCTIPESTNLFSCGFKRADISKLNAQITAQCVCNAPGCDGTPPICIDEDLAPRSCESCVNGIDDDDNGLIDCDDPNCQHVPPCPNSTTTTSTTTPSTSGTIPDSTTTTTSSSTSTTTSTLPVETISVTFALTSSSEPLGALQFTVNYASAPGQFAGTGSDVHCTNLVANALFAPNDNDGTKRLSLGLISLTGFSAPVDMVTCEFIPGTPVPVPANFTVVVNDATSVDDGDPVDVDIDVRVTNTP